MTRIVFLAPFAKAEISGGIKTVYRHAEMLAQLGFDAGVYQPEGPPSWFETDAKVLTDADLKMVASLKQLEQLELGRTPFPDERLALLKEFTHLKALRLVPPTGGFTPETQAKIKGLLPKAALKFD